MKALLPLSILFGFLTAMIVVLIVGARRSWSLARIGGLEFLVMAVANVALIAAGQRTTLAFLGAVWCGVAAFALLLRECVSRAAPPTQQPSVSPVEPDAALQRLSDDELVAYTTRLSELVAKHYAALRFYPLAVLSVLAVIFLGERFGVPPFVPIILVFVAFVGAIFPIARLWRADLYRSEAVLELDRRGLPRPQGTERVTAATVVVYRRGGLPMVLMLASFVLMLPLIALMLSEAADESKLLVIAICVLMAAMLASLVWLLAVLLKATSSARG